MVDIFRLPFTDVAEETAIAEIFARRPSGKSVLSQGLIGTGPNIDRP
jgi:hypothetical protein